MMRPVDDPIARELARLGELDTDELAVRRVREKFRQWAQLETERRRLAGARSRRWIYAAAIAVMGVCIAAVLATRHHQVAAPAAPPQPSSLASLEGDSAHWRSVVDDTVENIDLSDGTLRLHVKRPPGGKRVVVRVPDGEIEDVGTIFHVVVRDGHTARVGVDEGTVTIRIRGLSPITIGAGQTWERGTRPLVISTSSNRHAVAAPVAPEAGTPTAPALEGEDALYLSIVHAVRDGRSAEAAHLAHRYLSDFPNGFRKDEVAQLVEPGAP